MKMKPEQLMRFQYKADGATAQAHFCHIFGKISDRASCTERTRTRRTLSAEGGRFAGGDKTSRASPGNARALSYIPGNSSRVLFLKKTSLYFPVYGSGWIRCFKRVCH